MLIVLVFCLICLLFLSGMSVGLYRLLQKHLSLRTERREVLPPKGRKSFVVKRMEERLKEAMYPGE